MGAFTMVLGLVGITLVISRLFVAALKQPIAAMPYNRNRVMTDRDKPTKQPKMTVAVAEVPAEISLEPEVLTGLSVPPVPLVAEISEAEIMAEVAALVSEVNDSESVEEVESVMKPAGAFDITPAWSNDDELSKSDANLVLACDTGLRDDSKAYAVKAYGFPGDKDLTPKKNVETGEEIDPPETVDELTEAEVESVNEPDPNELHLPLEVETASVSPDNGDALELRNEGVEADAESTPSVEASDSAEVVEGEAVAEIDDETGEGESDAEPSSPQPKLINRISARVESILSSALARPAPAINFSDTLAELTAKTRKGKDDQGSLARLPSQALEDNLARSGDREGGLNMTEYKVQFEIFEGPLDLLLYLVKKQEVDIYEVNLTQIAEEFIKYIDMMRQFDLEVAGEFLVMAASLMYIKSKELLPVDKQVIVEGEEEEEEDPRWELIRQLVEYKKFKDSAAQLKEREIAQEDIYRRRAPKADLKKEPGPLEVSVFDLLSAVNQILQRFDARGTREIFADKWTVSEKIEIIRNRLLEQPRVSFTDLFEDAMSRTEVVVTFLALLELIRMKTVLVEQGEPFSDIEIVVAPEEHQKMTFADEPEAEAVETESPTQ